MITHTDGSITDLIKDLKQEATVFIREEIQLAKAELSDSVAAYASNGAGMAIGGLVAYAGLIVFLGGLGALLAFLFHRAGLDPLLAGFIGLGIIGLLVIGTGVVLLMKGIAAFKTEPTAPERTIRRLQSITGAESATAQELGKAKEKAKRSSAEVEASVMESEARMTDIIEELAERVSLRRRWQRATSEVRTHPYRWGLIAAGCGAAGSFVLKRRPSK